MSRQKSFAGERNSDWSLTLWFDAPEDAECMCGATPDSAHARLCPKAPIETTRPAEAPLIRSAEEHLRDIARTVDNTDIAERCEANRAAWETRQAARQEKRRFNPLARKLSAALAKSA